MIGPLACRVMWRWLILAVLLAACADAPAAQPAEPAASMIDSTPVSTQPTVATDRTTPADDAVTPDGYELVAARVTEPDGATCDLCLWLASTGSQRRQGLMYVTDLGPADGMAFVYPDPHSGWFWMKNTVMPLSIAFFAPDGSYMDAFDMEPCTSRSCIRYDTPDRFLVAVEAVQGGLPDLGMVPGSRLDLLDLSCGSA